MSIQVTVLGFNSAIPTAHTHPSAQVVNVNERFLLIDCGEGTQVQLRKAKIRFSKIDHIFISHLHGDHVFGLVGLISTFQLLGREKPLYIFGPEGIKTFINHQLKLTHSINSFPIEFKELKSTESELIFEDKKVEVYTIPLNHRVYCNGYLVVEKTKLRKLNMDAIQQYPEIETCDYLKIKKGFDFELSDGKIIKNQDLTYPAPAPKKYAYCSDTMYKPDIIPIIQGADLLYHEATFLDELKPTAERTGHSTAREAATIAKEAQVKKLMIGHFSNRYQDFKVLKEEAQEVFPATILPQVLKSIEV
ncbi:ribonuclease Z [Ornithobacterium rhinotracheale]